MASPKLTALSIENSPKKPLTETPQETLDRAKEMNNSISANDLVTPVETVKPPEPVLPTGDTSRTDSLIGGVAEGTQEFIRSQSENAQKADDLMRMMGGQSFDASGQREAFSSQYGLPDNLARLQDVQLQLANRNKQTQLQKAQATEGGAGAIQSQRALTLADKQAAIRDASLAAESAVLQGNIETAQSIINSAMSDYYQDRQLNNQNMINQIEYFQGRADAETAQLLEQEKREYQADQAKIEDLKTNIENALVSGASREEVQQLSGDKLSDEEKLTLAQSITARASREDRDLSRAVQQAQLDKANRLDTSFDKFGNLVDMQTGNVVRYADDGGGVNSGIEMPDGSFATADEIAYAQQYATDGKIPTGLSSAGVDFGRVSDIAKDMKKPDGALVSTHTGVTPSGVSAAQKEGLVAMSEIVNDTMPEMIRLWDEANKTNLGGTGVVGGISSKLIPSDAMQNYLQTKDEFLSKLLVARSGAAVTEQEYERYSKLIPGAFSGSLFLGASGDTKLDNLSGLMTDSLDNNLSTNQLTIYGYSTVDLGGEQYKVGEIVTNEYGQQALVQPDGSLTLLNQ